MMRTKLDPSFCGHTIASGMSQVKLSRYSKKAHAPRTRALVVIGVRKCSGRLRRCTMAPDHGTERIKL